MCKYVRPGLQSATKAAYSFPGSHYVKWHGHSLHYFFSKTAYQSFALILTQYSILCHTQCFTSLLNNFQSPLLEDSLAV